MRILVASTLACLLISTSASADTYTYKWTADNGTTQYTQVPPNDRPFIRVKTSSTTSKRLDKPAEVKKPVEVDESATAGEKALAETEAKAQDEKVKVAAQRAQNCETAKKNLIIMESRPRIRIPMSNGEYKVLSDEEKQAKIDETKKIILESCN